MNFFSITHNDAHTQARTGVIHTDHGDIQTPIFMPVGTQATVKSLDAQDIKNVGAQIILGNTYHLHLRPGESLINDVGGLHKFMQWDKPILTDSGGFQVFSLGAQRDQAAPEKEKLVKIDEDGVTFRSHIDGSTHRFTPESAIDVQHKLGADIIMAFDECTPDSASVAYATDAMERTHRWAKRCVKEHARLEKQRGANINHDYRQFLFGIIQGGNHQSLREQSATAISEMGFDGIAIGGESIGYNMEATKHILDWVNPIIPKDKPHYTMGVGFSPLDIFDVVEKGVDMFDCVAPTRMARNGSVYVRPSLYKELKTNEQKNPRRMWIDMNNARFFDDQSPIDPSCSCMTCGTYTRSYLHHLFKAEELLAYRLASIHNLHFLLSLMSDIRTAINNDQFAEYKTTFIQT